MTEFVKKIVERFPWLVWVLFGLSIVLLFGYLVENYWKDKIKETLDSSKKVNPTLNNPEEKPVETVQENAPATPANNQQQVNLAQMVQQGNAQTGLQDMQQVAMEQLQANNPQMVNQQIDNQQVVGQQVYQQNANGQVMDPNAQVQVPQEVYQDQQMYQDASQNIDPSIMQVDSSFDVSSLPVYNPTDQN